MKFFKPISGPLSRTSALFRFVYPPAMLRLLLAFLATVSIVTAADRPPNVVFILADDLGWGDLGCYGQEHIKTPNLDRMAAEGMRFTHMCAGNAVCAPSRCVLTTGKHPGHAAIRNNREYKPEGQEPIPAEEVTIFEAFKSAGYTTGGFGKWGLGFPGSEGEPLKQGIDRWYGYNCQGKAHTFYPAYLWDNDQKVTINAPEVPGHGTLSGTENGDDPATYARFTGKNYSADLINEAARQFVRDYKDRPFFCYVPTTVPHLALQVPADSLAEYQGTLGDDPPYKGGNGYLPHFAPHAAYAAMVTRMDKEVGQMMALIKELGLDEHTIFVFTSDNGALNGTHQGLSGTDAKWFNSCGGLRDGKGSLYEGGIREPGIVRWTGKIKAGVVSDRVCGFEDWMPTLLDLAGAKDKTPAGIDGISFAPTLRGESQPEREFLYREFPAYGGQQMLHMGNWKLVRQNLMAAGKGKAKAKAPKQPTLELYDLATDRHEEHDVAAQHPDIIAKMQAIMKTQHTPSKTFPFPALDN
jgi:arylsulfatase A-like enzyme